LAASATPTLPRDATRARGRLHGRR
jgi:hypothetical protein